MRIPQLSYLYCKPSFLHKTFYIILCCLHLSFQWTYGQTPTFKLNTNNGLTTNHIYCTHIDKYGYMWLGTTDGLFMYNGYTLRKYDYSDGLPNIDIWAIKEDQAGRIWPFCLAQDIGYISNMSYKNLFKQGRGFEDIYPLELLEPAAGQVAIVNRISRFEDKTEVGIVNNDTLSTKFISTPEATNRVHFQYFDHAVVLIKDSAVMVYDLSKWLKTPGDKLPTPVRIHKYPYHLRNMIEEEQRVENFADKYYCFFKTGGNRINFLDIRSGKILHNYLPVRNGDTDEIVFTFIKNNLLHLITNKALITIDSQLHVVSQQLTKNLFDSAGNGYNNSFFLNDNSWGTVLATNNNGLMIHFDIPGLYQPVKLDLQGYVYINRESDSTGYWWSNDSHSLIVIHDNKILKHWKMPGLHNVKRVIKINDNRLFVSNHSQTGWLENGTFRPLKTKVGPIRAMQPGYFNYTIDAINIDDSNYFLLQSARIGLIRLTFSAAADTPITKIYTPNRYNHILWNKKSGWVIAYSPDKIFVLDIQTDKVTTLEQTQLSRLGINGIEQMFMDDFGNIVIKQYDKLVIFNIHSKKLTRVFENYELTHAYADLANGKLTLAGSFGVVQCRLLALGKISNIRSFPNTKDIFFRYLTDVQFADRYVLLKTDNGIYRLEADSAKIPKAYEDFTILINTGTTLCKLSYNDTIRISPKTISVIADVIKPTGTGDLKIRYSIGGKRYTGIGSQIITSGLDPGEYYNVSVEASDKSWKGNPRNFVLYVVPFWWQTSIAKNIFTITALLLVTGIIYLSTIVTRRIVNRNHERRNTQHELELKSIYSQINPHFIFNTLSTAQYFVRKNKNKEALDHINQFSDLLRAYIKSSRNKYISIADEIENLENYLQLQLSRFEEKFDYYITVDSTINRATTKIPSLLLQPLIENALNHGIFHSDKKGILNISFTVDINTDELVCTIDDNGIGRQRSKELRTGMMRKADSYGTILIRELIDTFNKYEKIKIDIEYIDKQAPGSGTIVIVKIKNYSHAQ